MDPLRKQIVSFVLIRGLSAVLVSAHHLRAGMIVDFGEAQSVSLPLKAFYFLMSLGHEAVMVFFVLSGFFIGGTIIEKLDRFSPRQYAIARLSRLWTVLLPALLLTFLADMLLAVWHPELLQGQFQEAWRTGPSPSSGWRSDLVCFLGNMAFLQTILVPLYGTNFALWSLANEFWYYVLFPLLAFSLTGQKKLLCLCLFLLICLWLPSALLLNGFVWLLGVLLYLGHRKGIARFVPRWAIIPASIIFAATLVAVKHPILGQVPYYARDFVCGAGFSVFALSLLTVEGALGRVAWLATFLSKISYSLYLSHVPVLFLLLTFGLEGKQMQMDFEGSAIFSVFLLVIVTVGWSFWFIFERKTSVVRAWMQKHFSYRSDPVHLSG
jgi:peptidoglycan/LPS O-acetylase OafA/YrhL